MGDIVRASAANTAKENARYQKPSAHQAQNEGDEVIQKQATRSEVPKQKPLPEHRRVRVVSASCPDSSRQMKEVPLTVLSNGKVKTRLTS